MLILNRILGTVGAIGVSTAVWLGAPSPAFAASRYVFVTFKGDSEAAEKLSVYTSNDGSHFTILSNTGYGGPTGVLRDPSIIKHSDGKYYIAHTIYSWTTASKAFAIASSSDLIHWTHLKMVDIGISSVQHTWAPEWFRDTDGSVHIIVSADDSAEFQFRPFKFTAAGSDLSSWTGPEPIGISPNYIDTFIVKTGGTYHAVAKNETTKFIEHATASSLAGPWNWAGGKDDWAGWGSGKEGPALFQLESGAWRMFMDCYSGCGYLNTDSTDLKTWAKYATVDGLSGVRHGTVLREELGGEVHDAGSVGDGGGAGGRDGGSSTGGGGSNGSTGVGGRDTAGGAGSAMGGGHLGGSREPGHAGGSRPELGVGGRAGSGGAAGTEESHGPGGAQLGGDRVARGGEAAGQAGGSNARPEGAIGGKPRNDAIDANAVGAGGTKDGPLDSAPADGCGCRIAHANESPRSGHLAAALVGLLLGCGVHRRRGRRRSPA